MLCEERINRSTYLDPDNYTIESCALHGIGSKGSTLYVPFWAAGTSVTRRNCAHRNQIKVFKTSKEASIARVSFHYSGRIHQRTDLALGRLNS